MQQRVVLTASVLLRVFLRVALDFLLDEPRIDQRRLLLLRGLGRLVCLLELRNFVRSWRRD